METAMLTQQRSLRPSETALILQASIEGFTPQQVMWRDKLMALNVPRDLATRFLKILAVSADFHRLSRDAAASAENRFVDVLAGMLARDEALEVLAEWLSTMTGQSREEAKLLLAS